ncbi:hypothetical protein K270103H11_11950 [Gordonibacter urolithinfaciens]
MRQHRLDDVPPTRIFDIHVDSFFNRRTLGFSCNRTDALSRNVGNPDEREEDGAAHQASSAAKRGLFERLGGTVLLARPAGR